MLRFVKNRWKGSLVSILPEDVIHEILTNPQEDAYLPYNKYIADKYGWRGDEDIWFAEDKRLVTQQEMITALGDKATKDMIRPLPTRGDQAWDNIKYNFDYYDDYIEYMGTSMTPKYTKKDTRIERLSF